jgi:hypothetical protein
MVAQVGPSFNPKKAANLENISSNDSTGSSSTNRSAFASLLHVGKKPKDDDGGEEEETLDEEDEEKSTLDMIATANVDNRGHLAKEDSGTADSISPINEAENTESVTSGAGGSAPVLPMVPKSSSTSSSCASIKEHADDDGGASIDSIGSKSKVLLHSSFLFFLFFQLACV